MGGWVVQGGALAIRCINVLATTDVGGCGPRPACKGTCSGCCRCLDRLFYGTLVWFVVAHCLTSNLRPNRYALLLDTYIKDRQERDQLFSAYNNIPCVKRKGDRGDGGRQTRLALRTRSCFSPLRSTTSRLQRAVMPRHEEMRSIVPQPWQDETQIRTRGHAHFVLRDGGTAAVPSV